MDDWQHTGDGLHPNEPAEAIDASNDRRMLEWILAQPTPKVSLWRRITSRVRGWWWR